MFSRATSKTVSRCTSLNHDLASIYNANFAKSFEKLQNLKSQKDLIADLQYQIKQKKDHMSKINIFHESGLDKANSHIIETMEADDGTNHTNGQQREAT